MIHLRHAAEVYCQFGPTTSFAEVLEGEVHDYGGNALFSGTADQCVQKKFLTPTRLVPTKWVAVAGEVAGADHLWQPVMEVEAIELDDKKHKNESIKAVWNACDSTIFRVLDEDGSQPANGLVRHFLRGFWLYTDEVDGFDLLTDEDVDRLIIKEAE